MNHLGRRGREVVFCVAPLMISVYSKLINKFNGVNTVFSYYKSCSFALNYCLNPLRQFRSPILNGFSPEPGTTEPHSAYVSLSFTMVCCSQVAVYLRKCFMPP